MTDDYELPFRGWIEKSHDFALRDELLAVLAKGQSHCSHPPIKTPLGQLTDIWQRRFEHSKKTGQMIFGLEKMLLHLDSLDSNVELDAAAIAGKMAGVVVFDSKTHELIGFAIAEVS